MTTLINSLINDEAGFIVSAELVLISTIAVLGMIVGLSEVALNVNNELEDVGTAFSGMNQSFRVRAVHGHGANTFESSAWDVRDFCAEECDIQVN